MTTLEALKEYFGYDSFRPLQADIVAAIQHKRDTFALLPTGAGKSLCYQLPSVLMGGTTIVISPLIALMKDQVDALTQIGIKAAFLNSTQSGAVQQQTMEKLLVGKLTLLYVAPERLVQESFLQLLKKVQINFFAIDEAHCISQWGHDFRPEYRQMALLRKLFPAIPIVALTATATARVKKDIVSQLALSSPALFVGSFNRPNLSYAIFQRDGGSGQLLQLLAQHKGQSGIMYCQSRKLVEEVTATLNRSGVKALPYHAGLEDDVRRENQELYIRDECDVMVATVAFGMGINKPDVRFVVHYNMPKSIEHYYQETGRAGRDGLPASCYLLFSYADKILYERFMREMSDEKEQKVARQQLELMVQFAQSSQCRRSQLLAYFDEHSEVVCQNCDNCLTPKDTYDATVEVRQILSCVFRTGQRFAPTHVADVLKGAKNKKVLEYGHDQLSTYGLMKQKDVKQIKLMMYDLVQQGILQQANDQFSTISLGSKAQAVLKQGEKVWSPKYEQKTLASERQVSSGNYDLVLYEQLRELRREIAQESGLPPYMIFADKALQDMAERMPETVGELLEVFGVGEKKAEVYGVRFMNVIAHYVEKHAVKKDRSRVKVKKDVTAIKEKESLQEVPSTIEEPLVMYKEGMSIAKIAAKRGLKESTIVGHLADGYALGEEIDINLFVTPEKQLVIEKALMEHPTPFLGPIKRMLGEDYSYEEIKWVRAKMSRSA